MSADTSRRVSTWLLPGLFEPEQLLGGTAVVIDILRATTVVTHALANGAAYVVPCEGVGQARDAACNQPNTLLGGERQGVRIEGFDLTNSPADYSGEVVTGRVIAFTTTNGTRALARCAQAGSVLCGCFANLETVVARLTDSLAPVHLVCAGTNGRISNEDVLFAGAVVAGLRERLPIDACDSSQLAESFWAATCEKEDGVHQALRAAQGGKNLIALGYDRDIELCSAVNTFTHVPQLKNGRLT